MLIKSEESGFRKLDSLIFKLTVSLFLAKERFPFHCAVEGS